MENPVQVIITVIILSVALAVGVVVMDGVLAGAGEEGAGEATLTAETVPLDPTGGWVRIDTGTGTNETVYNSRGYAVNLTGTNDSYVQSRDTYQIAEDDTWTVAASGYVDADAENDTMTLVSVNGRVIIDYNGSGATNQWTAWYYDDGSRNSYRVNVSAPNQPASLTQVSVRSNSTHLTIYRNGTQGETVALSGDSIADANVNATNWNGRLDELRTYDDALTASQISTLHSQPNHPIAGTNQTSRAMFDEPGRSTQRLFFTNTELTTSNVTYSAGWPGEVMDGASLWNSITSETDYEWDTNGPKIRPVSGGELDEAPVAYVDYDKEDATDAVVQGYVRSIGIAALLPLLFVSLLVVVRLRNQ